MLGSIKFKVQFLTTIYHLSPNNSLSLGEVALIRYQSFYGKVVRISVLTTHNLLIKRRK